MSFSSEDFDDSDDNDMRIHKSPRNNPHHICVQSSTAAAHRDDDKVSTPDDEDMNRNLKGVSSRTK